MESQHKHWTHLWWAILQYFGRECKKTWGAEVIAVVVGGIAGAGTAYLRSHGKISFSDAVVDGLISAALFFAVYIVVHLFRSPWLERKSEGLPPSLRDGIFGAMMFVLLMAGSLFVCRLVADDLGSRITLSFPVDPGQLRALEECKGSLAELTKPESPDSLRRQTMKAANEVSDFLRGRFENHPPFAYPNSNDPNPSEERKAAIKKCQEYDQQTTDIYMHKYKDRMVNIIREYHVRSVPVGFLEQSFSQQVPIWVQPGSVWEDNPQNALGQFKELAFHVDARDQMIPPSF